MNFCDLELLTRAHGGAFYSKEHNFAYKSRKSLASDEKKRNCRCSCCDYPK